MSQEEGKMAGFFSDIGKIAIDTHPIAKYQRNGNSSLRNLPR